MCKAASTKSKEELLSVAQEIAFAKALASNDKSLRDRALRKLKKWFSIKSNQDSPGIRFTEEGFMRIWKGLFYCVWMSDKPLVQEECVEAISKLIQCFTELEDAQKFIRCFYQSISQAWFGLDSHRLDKYLMLVRRFLRQTLEYLRKESWETGKVDAMCTDLYKSLVMAPIGLTLHLSEIYLEEVAKVGRGELSPSTVLQLIKPFADFMSISSDPRLMKSMTSNLFLHLLRQSDEGIKHQAKFEVWRQMGFPEGDIDVIQEASDDEECKTNGGDSDEGSDDDDIKDDDDDVLDPRAGKVDVYLPPVQFDAEGIRQYLLEVAKRKDCTTKARKTLYNMAKKYEIFSQGKYPLGIHKVELPEYEDEEEMIEKTAEELLAEEQAAYSEGKQSKQSASVSWKVSPLQDQNINKKVKSPACCGKWEIQNLSKKRKSQCDNLVATMKRIKVTLDDSLITSENEDENMEVAEPVPSSIEEDKIVESNGQGGKRKRKRNKKQKVNNISTEQEKNDVNSPDESESKTNVPSVTNEEKRKKKVTASEKNDWGFQNDWDMATENEVNISVVPGSPVTPNDSSASSSKKKFTPTPKKTTPARNVAINTMLNSSKKVSFHLNRNTAQEEKEYEMCLKKSPSVPFDAAKKPGQSVLKSPSVFSPINPFLQVPL